jgi:hypothetical protein
MIRHEPMPVPTSKAAPNRQASAEVSPIDPCMVPRKACDQETSIDSHAFLDVRHGQGSQGVAPLNPSTAVQTWSPVMSPG